MFVFGLPSLQLGLWIMCSIFYAYAINYGDLQEDAASGPVSLTLQQWFSNSMLQHSSGCCVYCTSKKIYKWFCLK
jgi:hypothetical protein